MKKNLLFVLFFSLSLCGCASDKVEDYASKSLEEKPLTLMLASDLHYLSPRINDNGSAFQAMSLNADGKAMLYSEEVVDCLIDTALAEKPEALLLSGDLTFNGEKASHEDLTKKLQKLVDKGIKVLAIPGNHDLNEPNALAYQGETMKATPSIDETTFRSLYGPISYQNAYSKDPTSLSYAYKLRNDLYVLCLDSETVIKGYFDEDGFPWLEALLKEAKQTNAKVISMTHESLNVQNDRFEDSALLNRARITPLYKTYGVSINLSGHLHLQHEKDFEGIHDIATSSLMVSPNHYATLQATASSFSYQTHPLGVEAWAAKKGSKDPNLLAFSAYSSAYFNDNSARRVTSRLKDSAYSETEKSEMKDAYVYLNASYFAGTVSEKSRYPEGFELWEKSDLSYKNYIVSMLADSQIDFNSFVYPL